MASDVRYRLRFLLQELDLRPGVTLLGRSSECHITIEDPLVSRQHARIDVDGGHVTVRDLESRNGVKVNGVPVREAVALTHGDRIRIGTQEFVFTAVVGANAPNRTTGFMRHCARCRMPYSEEARLCPSCGSTEWMEETVTARTSDSQSSWEVGLLVEMIDRALARDRIDDAERLLKRATVELEQKLNNGDAVSEELVMQITLGVTRTALVPNAGPTWSCWLIRSFRRLPFAPTAAMREEIARLIQAFPQEAGAALEELRAFYRQQRPADAEQFARQHALGQLR